MNLLKNARGGRYLSFRKLDSDGYQIIYIVSCTVAVCMDPFFLYIPFLSHTKICLGMNKNLWKVTVALRSVADFFTFLLTINTTFTKSLKSILSVFVIGVTLSPIPQIVFSDPMVILRILRGETFWNLSLFCQYGLRLGLIFRSCEQLKMRVSITKLVRFNALVYLLLYLIVSHVIGASWYYLSIKRQLSCWHHACIDTGCDNFLCKDINNDLRYNTTSLSNSTLVNELCPINPQNAKVFYYGIYLDALQSRIVEEKGLPKKFLRCFFWGLRNLSSFASNLQTSTNSGETFFAVVISIVALILLIYIIGNIQRYTDLASARSEKIVDKMELIKPKIKLLVKSHNLGEFTETLIVEHTQRALEHGKDSFKFERMHFTGSILKDLHILESSVLNSKLDIQGNTEKWLLDNNIHPNQKNILFHMKCRLEEDQDVNLKSVLSVLPFKHEWMTKKDLCFDTLKKVPWLQNIDEESFRSMSIILKPFIYPKESYIFREGEPLEFIILITNGIAWRYTTVTDAGGRASVSINSLKKGDFFGVELLEWKLDKIRELKSDRIPLSCIPISTANVKSHTQVEALVLMINDLALCSDFPVATSKLRRIIRNQMILNADQHKRSADSATEGVDSSSRTEESAYVQREIEEV